MPTGTFTANLDADNIFIDLSNLPATIKQKFHIHCQNQSLYALYFKVICGISDWSLLVPLTGELGSVNAGSYSEFDVDLTRTNPLAETIDSGNLTLEVYSDAGYSTLVDSMDLACTVNIEDLESWTDVTIYTNQSDFASFSGGTATDEISVEVGGYSYRSPELYNSGSYTLSRASTPFPDFNKVRLCVYFVLRGYFTTYAPVTVYLNNLKIQVNSIDQGELASTLSIASVTGSVGASYSSPWLKLVIDVSAFKNTSQLLSFIGTLTGYFGTIYFYGKASFIIDRIVIAGRN